MKAFFGLSRRRKREIFGKRLFDDLRTSMRLLFLAHQGFVFVLESAHICHFEKVETVKRLVNLLLASHRHLLYDFFN